MLVACAFLDLTNQLIVFIVAARFHTMGVGTFSLFFSTGQDFCIYRLFHSFKAGIRVMVLQNLIFTANQVAIIVEAVRSMFVGNDFFFLTGQHLLHGFGFRGFCANTLALYLFVALVGMLMGRFRLRGGPAAFVMGVGLNYR